MQPVSMSGADAGSFTYDGNYRRAKQVINGESPAGPSAPSIDPPDRLIARATGCEVYTVYGLSGELLYRDNATTGQTTDYVNYAGGVTFRFLGNGEVHTVASDHLGSPIVANRGAARQIWREEYTPHGEPRLSPAANDNDQGFTGHIADTDTGLAYMQARYYDPVIGRFLSPDPVGFASGGVGYFNRYAYVANDPVNVTDPTGMCPNCITGAIGGGIGGVVGGVTGFFTTSGGIGDRLLGAGAGAAGGAVTGAIIGGTGNVVGGFAAGGATTSVVRQLTTGDGQVSVAETAVDTAVSATVGKVVPGVKVPGITSGNGSFQHVANTQTTRLAQGQISSVSPRTAGKAVVAGAVGGSGQNLAIAGAGGVRDGVIAGVDAGGQALGNAIDTAQSIAGGIADSIPQNPVNQCDLGGPC